MKGTTKLRKRLGRLVLGLGAGLTALLAIPLGLLILVMDLIGTATDGLVSRLDPKQ